MMFIVLSCHCPCKSSPSSFDECSTLWQMDANLWTNLISLSQCICPNWKPQYYAHHCRWVVHHQVIATALRPPADWRRSAKHPRTTWLRTVDEDIQPQNFGVHTACRKAKDRDICRQVISTAMLWDEFAKKRSKSTKAFTLYLFYHHKKNRRLNWPGCLVTY